jgi:hypothetical protein
MSKMPDKIEVVQEGGERFLIKKFADRSEERQRGIVECGRESALRSAGTIALISLLVLV